MKKLFSFIIVLFALSIYGNAQNTSPYWSLAGNSNASPSSKLGTTGNTSLRFYTNNVQRMIINSVEGYIGIGTPTPNSKVHINSASGQDALRVQVNASTKFLVNSSGRVGIGTTSPKSTLDVAGTIIGFDSYFGKTYPVSAGTSGASYSSVGYGLTFSDTTANYRYRINNDYSSMLSFRSGGFDFNTAPIGTAGTTIPYTTAMAILQNGNVGIGTSAPFNRLEVAAGFDGDGIRVIGSSSGPKDAAFILTDNLNHRGSVGLASANEAFMKGVTSGDLILSNNLFNTGGKIRMGTGSVSFFPAVTVDWTGLAIANNLSGNNWQLHVGQPDARFSLYFNNSFRGSFNTTNGVYTAISDERLKTNIKPMSTLLGKINLLKPSTYQFKNAKDQQEYNGFIAQDVMKIFPSLVMHNVDPELKLDVYTMDYSGFGVIAIKGIQELQPIIEDQKEKIATLEGRILKLEAALQSLTANNANISNNITRSSLEQNKPNPFNKNTIIRYSIPQGSKGQINIYDPTGKLVKTLQANENGHTELSGYNLASGTYTYTLTVNGKATTSKQMLIIK